MNLQTKWLGLTLAHPLIAGASPQSDDLDSVRRVEDGGASAIVMRSLFEEQIAAEREATDRHFASTDHAFAEASSFLPSPAPWGLGSDAYLEQLRRTKAAVHIPVIASINGQTGTGWVEHARLLSQAGADAIELNMYFLATSMEEDGASIEARVVAISRDVKAAVGCPVAVKLSPFFSSIPNLVHRLDQVGVDGVVLFNRFYQPDIDVELLDVSPRLVLSESSDLLLRLRWLAVLHGRVRMNLAATGGAHTGLDVIKAIMAGADAVQVVSAALRHGPSRLGGIRAELIAWMEDHEYEGIGPMRGSMSLLRCPDPAAFERANYSRILQGWRVP